MWKELEGKRIGVFDTETDGLINEMTKMHYGCVVNAVNREEFTTGDPVQLCDHLDQYEVLVGHNIIGFDLPMLHKKFGWKPKPHVIIVDTLWLSRMYHPDIDNGHSLGSWGERLGNPKLEYYPVMDPEQPVYNPEYTVIEAAKDPRWKGSIRTHRMMKYCDQDVDVNVDVFWKLVELLKNFTWQSIECEMVVALLIQRQMEHGFVFHKEQAEVFHAKLVERIIELEDEVHRTFMPLPKPIREVQPTVKKDGTLSSVRVKCLGDQWPLLVPVPEFKHKFGEDTEYISGAFTLIEWPEFSLGSRQQIAERLQRAGYKLTKVTEKGNYIIDDVVLQEAADAGIPEAKPLAEYFLIQKLEAMVKNWIAAAVWHKDQGVYRVHGYVNSHGAASSRMTHSNPNVAQVPAPSSTYGKQCRSLFTVRKGYKLVGCDASGLELRMLACYMKDREYSEAIVNGVKELGTDIHTVNMKAAGLSSRDQAKTMVYALLYGAGDSKLGKIIGGGTKEGKALKEKFFKAIPAMGNLSNGVKKAAESRGWLKGLDGRILRTRSPHSALNMLLQGGGAIVMKYWLIEFTSKADALGLDYGLVANVHDEAECEVREDQAETLKKIMEEAFVTISKKLELFCELAGEAAIGDTWYDVH